jgi:ADP-L-glycero-D-manno-heptose 6-epimerase
MRVVVTGAAGFIGSNLVHGLNGIGIDDVIAVDDLTHASKYRNLLGAHLSDYFDHEEFYRRFANGEFGTVDAVLHQGACSDTMEHNGRYMMQNNYRCSKNLLDACQAQGARLLYASSAAIYGGSTVFVEEPRYEQPLNGPREQHKGRMASVAYHHSVQLRQDGRVKLFGEYGGYAPGTQERDFIYVDDVVAVNLWFLQHPQRRGIFNLGSGRAQPFNDVAHATVNAFRRQAGESELTLAQQVSAGLIEYIPFPEALVGKYQNRTLASLDALRATGCDVPFVDVATGVARYMDWLSWNLAD